jgi:ubiquinone/menaquinone biosynthesis C-methylase UbiE
MPNYGEKKYWEERYESQKGKTFDWLEDYKSLKPIIKDLGIRKDAFILNIGCGNSEFSEKMYNDGFKSIYNIDICENVINYMKERNKDKKGLSYQVMDVRDMKGFKDDTFDFIIDKSTLDALLCGEKSFVDVVYMTKEISRILKEGGIYFIISYGRPEYRLFHLQRKHLTFDIQVLELKQNNDNENTVHYIYVCKKLPEAKKNINKIDIVLKEMGF